MSPERPPSHDNVGISPPAGMEPTTNMVLSAIPLDGHVVIQQSPGARQSAVNSSTTTYTQIPSSLITAAGSHSMTKTTFINGNGNAASLSSPSKYVFFQHNGNGQYTSNEAYITTSQSQSTNVGNIVLLASEPLEMGHTENVVTSNGKNEKDEELTSLTWLHDKNLIKGIVSGKNTASPSVLVSNGGTGVSQLSPTSDFLEDSCISEDNVSSLNSTSDQGISVHSSPLPVGNNAAHMQFGSSNNNNSINKNRNHILSPGIEHHLNGNGIQGKTTVHVGPSGTTTVVEYKPTANFVKQANSNISNHVPSSPQRTVVVTSSTPVPAQQSTSTTTSHHPHKKYLREQMNGYAADNSGASSANSSKNSTPSLPSSPSYTTSYTITSNQPQGMANLYPEPATKDYHHTIIKSPASYSTNSYETDSLKDFEIITSAPSGSLARSPTNGGAGSAQKSNSTPKQKHPTNVPYDPLVHTHNKPPYSFSSLIFMAIEDSPEKALPVKEIYAWIVQHFPYFKTAPTGWKNSVRHNLSLNKSFVKVEKAPNMGKGSLWRVEQLQRPNLIQALTRSPFFPCSAVDKISQKSPSSSPQEGFDSPPMTPVKSHLDSRLFPKLSKMIKEMVHKNGSENGDAPIANSGVTGGMYYSTNNTSTPIGSYESIEHLARDCGADSIDDVNAATAMLALKHGPKVFSETFQNGSPVITSSPSEDHTYSAGGIGGSSSANNGSAGNSTSNTNDNNNRQHNGGGHCDNQSNCASSDAAYESSEDSHNITPEELDEQQRRGDGVDALLSLSSMFGSSPLKRPSSTTVEEEHISSYMENIPHLHGKGSLTLASNGGGNVVANDGYNISSYYAHYVSPSPSKKVKRLRSLRAKIKPKTVWIR